MGYLTNKYVKSEGKKRMINIAIDILLIIMLIWMGLTCRGEFENGAKWMLQNVPAFCVNATLYQNTLDYYNITTPEDPYRKYLEEGNYSKNI